MPHLLVNKIPVEPFLDYPEFAREIKRFSPYEFLALCNRFANWVDSRRPPDCLVKVPDIGRYQVALGSEIYLDQVTLAFLAKECILHATGHRHSRLTPQVLTCLAYYQANLKEIRRGDPRWNAPGLLLRTYEQYKYRLNASRMIPRAKLMLLEGNRLAPQEVKPFDLEDVWVAATGISMEKFMMIGFGYFAGALKHTRLHRYFPSRGILSGVLTEDDCEAFLAKAGASYDEFRKLSEPYCTPDPLFVKSEFNALTQRPIVSHGRQVLVPIPRLLLARISDGLFFDIEESLESRTDTEALRRYFGYLFEQYVGRLLKDAFGEDKVHGEESYKRGKNRVEGPDWIVLDGGTALLFECRSRRISLASKVFGEAETIAEDMKKMLVETVRKFPAKVEDLRSGRVPIDFSGIRDFIKVIVVHDRILFEDLIFRTHVRDQLEKDQAAEADDYKLIDIEDLENLTAWNRDHPAKAILASHTSAPDTRMDLADFINAYAVENQLASRHEWLDSIQDEFFALYGLSKEALEEQSSDLELGD